MTPMINNPHPFVASSPPNEGFCARVGCSLPFDNEVHSGSQPEISSSQVVKALKEALELVTSDVQVCPNCNNVGYYADGPTDDPEQVQCEFCYTVPNSLFNVKQKARSAIALQNQDCASASALATTGPNALASEQLVGVLLIQ